MVTSVGENDSSNPNVGVYKQFEVKTANLGEV